LHKTKQMDFFSTPQSEHSVKVTEQIAPIPVHYNVSIVSRDPHEEDFTIELVDNEIRHHLLDNSYFNLLICLEGDLSYSSDKANLKLSKGGAFFSKPGNTANFVVSSGVARYYRVAFKENFVSKTLLREAMLDKLLATCGQGFVAYYPEERQFEYIKQLSIKLHQEMIGKYALHKQIIKLLFIELMLEFARGDKGCSGIIHGTVHYNRSQQLYDQFTKLVEMHYLKFRFVQDYADLLFVTAKHLSEVIKRETGETALHLIHSRLFSEAKFLLCRTDMSLKEIANKMGFDTSSHFGRFIKQFSGYSPSDYRAIQCAFA